MPNRYSLKSTKTERQLPLSAASTSVGRDEDSDICLYDDDVSREHAVIYKSTNGVVVTDLGSTNGTYVNGQKIQSPTRLLPGNSVQFGNEVFSLDMEDLADATLMVKTQFGHVPQEKPSRSGNFLNLFAFKQKNGKSPVTSFAQEHRETIDKYLNYFKDMLAGQRALALFFFRRDKPLAIQCVSAGDNGNTWTIGRSETSYLLIDHPSVSKNHAVIEYLNDDWHLLDVGATNGVKFEGTRVKQLTITDGQIVQLGDVQLFVRCV